MKDRLAQIQPSVPEAVFAILIVGFAVNLAFAYLDVTVHDNSILLIIANCYPENQSDFCIGAREVNDCPPNSQMCLGQKYWMMLPFLVLLLSIGFALARTVFALLAGAKVKPMLFIIGFAWFLTGIMLPYFGWGDYVYYVLKGENVDSELAWLDNAGFLKYMKVFGKNPDTVDDTDLYTTMVIGLSLLIGMWAFLVHHHKKKTFEKLRLA